MIAVKKKFYITTAIDYVNAEPHIGHAYQKIAADVLARFNKQLGKDVFLLTGTDEHGQKVESAAEGKGLSAKKFADKLVPTFKEAWKILEIDFDRFIRTTDKDHEKTAVELAKKIFKKGDIYKGEYEGLYCVGCERYYTEKDLENGLCPYHKKEPILLKEETYFFRLSKYQNKLLELYKKHPEFILPATRRNEIINRVKEGLKDLSITRTSFTWGIPSPFEKGHILYVWFEALINYLSGIDYPKAKFKKYWPADYHLLGKDNAWFHCVIWPAILYSAGIELPRTVYVHGFLTYNGQKMSKSLGNIISPKYLVGKFGADTVRYAILRDNIFSEDGDVSEENIARRNNSELANSLGNLVSRSLTLIEKADGKVPSGKFDASLKKKFDLALKKAFSSIEKLEFHHALEDIWAFITDVNNYIQQKQPWTKPEDLNDILYTLAESLRIISALVYPFIPETAGKIAKQLGVKVPKFSELKKQIKAGTKIKKGEILFKKIEFKEAEISHPCSKLNIRVAKIIKVEDFPEAEKPLYKIYADFGKLGKKQTAARLKPYFSKKELEGKKILAAVNLLPVNIAGFKSEFLTLAAVDESYLRDAAFGSQFCTRTEANVEPDATKNTKEGLELLCPEASALGDRAYFEGCEGEPAKQISLKDFEKLKLKVGDNNQIVSGGKALRTKSEVIKVKRMKKGARIC